MKEKLREDILKNSLDLFVERTYEKVFIADIAKACGVSRGSIYWRFKNKEEILSAISNKMTDTYLNLFKLDNEYKNLSFNLQIRIILEKYINIFEGESDFIKFKELIHFKMADKNAKDILRENSVNKILEHKKAIQKLIEYGKVNDEIDNKLDSEFIAMSILNFIMNFERFFLEERRIFDLKANKKMLVENIMKLLEIKN